MLSSVGQNNNVQRFTAVNALRTSKNLNKQSGDVQDNILGDTHSGTSVAPKNLLDRVDVSDIRKFAEYVGEYDITDDDIKYGLMYGRSVIAEYLC